MAKLVLTLFGPPTVTRDRQPIHIGRRKALALLAYLAVNQRTQSRAHLATLLWPLYDEAGARAELRRALSTLNQALGAAWLEADRETVRLAADGDLQVDVVTFRRHLTAARSADGQPYAALRTAVDLAQADLLNGFTVDDAPDFEEWQRFEAAALRRELAWALAYLAQPRPGQESPSTLAYVNRWLAVDPLDEAAHRRLMELHAAAGDLSAAYRQYQECKQLLERELGVPPAAETTTLYEAIRAGNVAKISFPHQTETPPPTSQSPIPAQHTPFVGRAHELRELAALLAGGQRLITLTGPGGIGKTRLALQAAHSEAAAARWRDGVYFIDMTAVERGELLVATLAEGLGVALAVSQPLLEQLVGYLRHKQLLLVIDNLEQLLTAHRVAAVATLFDELLLHAPGVTMLTTSRERLNLHGEMVFNVLGMPFPAAVQRRDDAPDSTLATYDAIRLFCQSAQRADRAFRLTTENQAAVVQICQLVQGMPLAIDLAAAWVRMLTCAEIATEIAQHIDFLATSAHNLPARHRSMAAVFQHSWQLLTAQEQAVFIRLACFRGGCTRDAAQAVTGATLPTLSTLIDKSLLQRSADGRFVIHELLREFAAEKLAQEKTATATVATRHSNYYLALLARWEAAFLTHERMTAFRTLQPELDNIRYAWDWAVQQQDLSGLAQGLQTLYTLFLEIINGFDEGIQRFGRAIAMVQSVVDQASATGDDSAPQNLLARLQARSAQFHLFTGQIEEAAVLFAASLESLRTLDDQPEIAFVLTRLAMARLWQGDLPAARTLIEEALTICRQHPVPGGLQAALTNYGYIAQQSGDFALAEALNLECLALLRISGDPDGLASTLGNLGLNYHFQEQYEAALPYLEEALTVSTSIGNRSRIAIALTNLMDIYMKVGRLAEARRNGAEALTLFTDLGQRQYAAILESSLGYLALAEGDAAEDGAGDPASTSVETAQIHFWRALTIANEIDVDLIRVYGVTGFGELLARRAEHERATALLTLAAEFPTSDPDITGRATARLRQLAAVLPDERYQQAQRLGRTQSLAAVAADLMAAFQDVAQPSGHLGIRNTST